MPMYDYECTSCPNKTTIIKSVSEIDKAETCSVCNSPMKRNGANSVGAKFVGSGFYVNDYVKKGVR